MTDTLVPRSLDQAAEREDDVELLNTLAQVQALYGGHEAALCLLAVADYLQPGHPETIRAMARINLKLGKPQVTVKLMSDLRSMEPAAFGKSDWLMIARAFARAGKIRQAKKLFAILKTQQGTADSA